MARLVNQLILSQAVAMLDERHTISAIKGQLTRAKKTYTEIVAFEDFTGNGGGDGDLEEVEDPDHDFGLDKRLAGARKAGLNVGKLSVKTLTQWYQNGWYDLYNNR